jgi:transposase
LTPYSRGQLARKVLEEGVTLKLAAASFNVSPKTAAKWVRRFREGGPQGLGDRSSRPRHCHRSTSLDLIEQVLSFRRLRWNGWRIALELGLSGATVSRILRRAGMNRLRSLDPPPPVLRYTNTSVRAA